MSIAFYQELLQCDSVAAKAVSGFMSVCAKHPAIKSAKPWSKNGFTRVYLELWSQNSLTPVEDLNECYFSADRAEVVFKVYRYQQWSEYLCADVCGFQRGMFSGAKTRARLQEFCEVFAREKATWS